MRGPTARVQPYLPPCFLVSEAGPATRAVSQAGGGMHPSVHAPGGSMAKQIDWLPAATAPFWSPGAALATGLDRLSVTSLAPANPGFHLAYHVRASTLLLAYIVGARGRSGFSTGMEKKNSLTKTLPQTNITPRSSKRVREG